MRFITSFLLAILIIPAMFISWSHSEAKVEKNDTLALLEISKPLFLGEYNITIKWSAELSGYTSIAAFQAQNKRLSQGIGAQSSEDIEDVNGLPVLRSWSQQADGAQLQSMLVGSKDQKTTVWILKLTAASSVTMAQMEHDQLVLEQELMRMGINGSWNTMVQGTPNVIASGDSPEVFLQTANSRLQGIEQEIYQEDHTLSVSILSNKMHYSVQSGAHKVNLQLALHQNSITKAWRFTIGSPLITMEY
jgi:hypothetical protein